MTGTETPARIAFTLDAQIPLERVILERLRGLNRRSQQTWIRALIVEGFLLESRAVQNLRDGPSDVSRATAPRSAPFRLTPRFTGNAAPNANAPLAATMPTTSPNDKPFAALRRVIG